MSIEENKAIVRRYFEEGLNRQKLAIVYELLGPDFINHSPRLDTVGREETALDLERFFTAFPDWHTGIEDIVAQHVAPGSTLYTDGLKSFTGLEEAGFQHVARTQPLRTELRKGAKSVVPLADRAIGNMQQWLIGTYHGVSRAQLQVYLDEFVFRHNRRKTPMAAFQTLLGLGTQHAPTVYARISGARDLEQPQDDRHPNI